MLFVAIAPIGASIVLNLWLPGSHWENPVLHAAIESAGAFAALTVATLILIAPAQQKRPSPLFWAACALTGLALFDGLHAFTTPHRSYEWLHCLAIFVGGCLFAGVWLPVGLARCGVMRICPLLLIVGTLTLGGLSYWLWESLPIATTGGHLILPAGILNALGCCGFFAAAVYFATTDPREEPAAVHLFAHLCVLFGVSGLLFGHSVLWDATWWMWHFVHLAAYGIAVAFFLLEYRRSAEDLRQTSGTLSSILASPSMFAIAATDLDFRILHYNPAAERLFGYSAAEVIGRSVQEMHTREQVAPERFQHAVECVQREGTWEYTATLKDPAGEDVHVHSCVMPMRDGNGEHVGYVLFSADVTSQKQAEEALRASERRFRQLTENIPLAIQEVDPQGTIIYANPAHERLYGYERGELLGKRVCELPAQESERSRLAGTLAAIVKEMPAPGSYASTGCRKDGSVIDIRVDWNYKRDHAGKLVGFTSAITDITKQRQAERTLRLDEERLRSLLQLSQMDEASERQLIEFALEEAVRLSESRIGYLHLVNPDNKTIRLHSWSKAALAECTTEQAEHYPIDEAGVWADCLRQGRAVVHNDYQSLPDKNGYPPQHSHITRHVSVPVHDGRRVVAIIGVGNKEQPYDDHDVRQLTLYAKSMWQILQRLRAESELRRYREHLEEMVAERTLEIQAAHEREASLHELLQLSLEGHTLEEQLDRALGQILRSPLLEVEQSGAIFLVGPDPGELELKAQRNLPAETERCCACLPTGQCLCHRAVQTNEIQRSGVNDNCPGTYPGGNATTHHHCCVPIASGQRVLGVIMLHLPPGKESTGQEREFLMSAANTVAGIIQRKRAEDSLQQRVQELSVLRAIDERMNQSLRLDELSDEVLANLLETLSPDLATFFRVEGTTLTLLGARSRDREERWIPCAPHVVGECLCERSVEYRIAIYARDLQGDLRCKSPECNAEGFRSYAAVPLRAGEEIIGVIGLASREERDFARRSDFLETLAHTVAIGLQNGLLFESATLRAAELQEANARLTVQIEERRRLSTAVEHVAEAIIVTDAHATAQYVNPAFERITEYQRHEVIGQNPRILKSGQHDEAFYRDLWQTITAGGVWKGKITNRRKSGTLFTEEATISPIHADDGTIRGYVGVKRDITQQLVLENSLQQAQKLEAIGTLAGGIAHDFNNILGAIIGYNELSVKLIQEEQLPPLNYLQAVAKATDRAKDLINQILAFSRQSESAKRPVGLGLIVKEVLKLLRASLPSTIEIRSIIASNTITAMADPTQIHQVVVNLCTNAGHAMRDQGGVLDVSLEPVSVDGAAGEQTVDIEEGIYAKLTVSDTGHGMDEQILRRIFDPFFTTKPPGEGTGLGLSVVHGIVESHGGAIAASSQPGAGTTFEVFLPMINGEAAFETEDQEDLPGGRERILVVDDEVMLVDVVCGILESLGYDVVGRSESFKALETFLNEPNAFDLVLTDLTMPEMTGINLAWRIYDHCPHMPVIVCTGNRERCANQTCPPNIREILSKPAAKRELAYALRRVLQDTAVTTCQADE